MLLSIKEEDASALPHYAKIPMSFSVTEYLHVERGEEGDITCVRCPAHPSYQKDYDRAEKDRLVSWSKRWNVENWGYLSAFQDELRMGSAVIAHDTSGLSMLENRQDLAVLWDLRVHPDYRSQGVGTKLFNAACHWAKRKDCSELKIETQNTNVPAYTFYERNGCILREFNPNVYPEQPEEIQLLMYTDLTSLVGLNFQL